MDRLLSLVAPGLWIHQLGLSGGFLLRNLHPDSLMPLILAVQKGLLILNELLFRPTLVSFLRIGLRLKLALFVICSLRRLNPLLLYLSDTFLFPRGKSLSIFTCGLVGLHLFLLGQKDIEVRKIVKSSDKYEHFRSES